MARERKKFVDERPKPKALFGRVFLSLLLAGCATAQVASQLPKLSILLPVNTPPNKFEVQYYLYESFGANGGYISPNPDSTGVVKIPLSVDGKMANEIKLCRGVSSRPTISACMSRTCRSFILATHCRLVTLHGQIADKSLLQKTSSEIRVDYLAGWACDFFGLSDCAVPQISLGTVTAERTATSRSNCPILHRIPPPPIPISF
jgi:hypothetical protein